MAVFIEKIRYREAGTKKLIELDFSDQDIDTVADQVVNLLSQMNATKANAENSMPEVRVKVEDDGKRPAWKSDPEEEDTGKKPAIEKDLKTKKKEKIKDD